MATDLSLDDFAPHCGHAFMVGAGEQAVRCTLASASALGSGASAPGGRPGFVLLFNGPGDVPLQQGLHRVQHPARGALDIFLVPVGRDATGLQYEAVFN